MSVVLDEISRYEHSLGHPLPPPLSSMWQTTCLGTASLRWRLTSACSAGETGLDCFWRNFDGFTSAGAELGHRSPNDREAVFMNVNPWLRLPASPPYVLPEDEQAVREFNASASEDHQLQIARFLPEPIIGDPAAPVLLLSNNPGFSKHSAFREQPEFMTRIRDCISLKVTECPFYYLAPGVQSRWWRQKLKCLLQKFGDDVVARFVCNVVFFPYVSKKFAHGKCKLPSQEFSFRLVRKAMERGAVIVLMRKGRLKQWQMELPGLGDYHNLILLRNPQMPAVSPKNCDDGDYERIVAAIEQAERGR